MEDTPDRDEGKGRRIQMRRGGGMLGNRGRQRESVSILTVRLRKMKKTIQMKDETKNGRIR